MFFGVLFSLELLFFIGRPFSTMKQSSVRKHSANKNNNPSVRGTLKERKNLKIHSQLRIFRFSMPSMVFFWTFE